MLIDAIVGHLVGDYLLQDDLMAMNKKTNSFICFAHCWIWASCVMLFGMPWATNMRWTGSAVFLILVVTHFIQDRTNLVRRWMSFAGQEKFASGPLSPWSIVVVDNVLHIVTIYAVWRIFAL